MTAFHLGRIASEARLLDIERHLEECAQCLELLGTFPDDTRWIPAGAPTDTFLDEPQFRQALDLIESIPESLEQHDLPRQIGDYEVLERLGSGGMGTVYKAWHSRLGRPVVLKMMRERTARDPSAVEQFRAEMAAVGRIDHPAIVRAYDAAEFAGREYLVMEFVPGENLRTLLARDGPFSLADASAVIHEVAIGLQHLHDHTMVHRDIKPSNIVLGPAGNVKILDLGLAVSRRESASPPEAIPVTIQGTVDFMAPEQAEQGPRVTPAADLYSLGATFYTLLVGRPPFADRLGRSEKLAAVRGEPAPDLAKFCPAVPRSARQLIAQLLNKSPEQRPRSAREVAAAVRGWAQQSSRIRLTDIPATVPLGKHRLVRSGAMLMFGCAVIGIGTMLAGWYAQRVGSGSARDVAADLGDRRPEAEAQTESQPPSDAIGMRLPAASMPASAEPAPRPPYRTWKVGYAAPRLAGLAEFPTAFPGLRRWQVDTIRPRGLVRAMAASPDGVHLAMVGDDENIRVFRRTTGGVEFHGLLPATASGIVAARCLAWSPDGRLLATAVAAGDRPIEVWDWNAATRVLELRGHSTGVRVLAWSHSGTHLASAGSDGRVRLWTRDGLIAKTLACSSTACDSLAWHPRGERLAVGTEEGVTSIWDLDSQEAVVYETSSSPVVGLAWRPQGDQLAVVTQDHTLRILDATSLHTSSLDTTPPAAPPRTLRIQSPYRAVFWSHDGGLLHVVADVLLQWNRVSSELMIVSDSRDGFVEPWIDGCWCPATNSLLTVSLSGKLREYIADAGRDLLRTPRVYVRDIAWNRESSRMAICSIDNIVQVWGGQGKFHQMLVPHRPATQGFRCAAWSLGGRYLAAGELDPNGLIHVWNLESQAEIAAFPHGATLEGLAWSDDASWLVSVGADGRARTWQPSTNSAGPTFELHSGPLTTVSTYPHTRRFATGGWDRALHVWEMDDHDNIRPIASWPNQPEPIWSVAWSPQGDRLLVSGTEQKVWLLDAATGDVLWSADCVTGPGRVSWKQDGQRVYCNGRGVLDAHTGNVLTHAAFFEPASYSPDGRWVAEITQPEAVTVRHASHQTNSWRAVAIDRETSVTLGPSGQVYYSNRSLEGALVYVIETEAGVFQTLKPVHFENRVESRISK